MAEVVVAEAHETTVLHALEVDRIADVDKAAEGADWSHVAPPAPRTVDWFPESASDSPAGLEP